MNEKPKTVQGEQSPELEQAQSIEVEVGKPYTIEAFGTTITIVAEQKVGPNSTLVGLELLGRPKEPDVEIGEVIAQAEDKGTVGEYVRETLRVAGVALNDLENAHVTIPLAVNVPPTELNAMTLAVLQELHKQQPSLTSSLEIEITERQPIDPKEHRFYLEAMHEMGFPIVLDDFGAGEMTVDIFARMPWLRELVSKVKIDKSVYDNDERLQVVLALLHEPPLNFSDDEIILEGVEYVHEEKSAGHVCQGYAYGAPKTLEEYVQTQRDGTNG